MRKPYKNHKFNYLHNCNSDTLLLLLLLLSCYCHDDKSVIAKLLSIDDPKSKRVVLRIFPQRLNRIICFSVVYGG